MNSHSKQQTKLTLADHAPCLEAAILNWNKAFHSFHTQPSKEHQDAYCKRCDQLGQSIARWEGQQPDLVDQFRLWFRAHESGIKP